MKTILFRLFVVFVPVAVATASVSASAGMPASAPSVLQAAADARKALADAVSRGTTKAADAITSLHAMPNPSGLPVDGDSDFGLAASDIGCRILGAHKPDDAMVFFLAAEDSLAQALKGAAGQNAGQKVQLLRQLAFLRSQFLGEFDQAKADIAAALVLQPNDADLIRFRDFLLQSGKTQLNPASRKG
ncbi:MAG TPA: hypothetical protein VHD32_10815 [Candidatus Didemnitutus sp.]|nr:hypothetical protein [Candidatus Didemnitutus sp.]